MIYILTVCYNNLVGLKKTYDSIKNQSSKNYRWVVIDGNSIDGTSEWLESLEEPCLDFMSEPDKGIYDAMNKAIGFLKNIPNGYFIFMNSGDEFYDHNVLNKIGNIKTDSAIIYGDYNDVNIDGTSVLKKSKDPSHLVKGMLTSHQAIFFSVSEYKNLYHDLTYKLSGDYDYIIRAFEVARLKQLPTLNCQIIICNFYLDGVSVLKRTHALKEDFKIRRYTLELNILYSGMLYFAHLIHFILKKLLPSIFAKRRF